jgi:hypothetical protein
MREVEAKFEGKDETVEMNFLVGVDDGVDIPEFMYGGVTTSRTWRRCVDVTRTTVVE